jgi:hypothetical protein
MRILDIFQAGKKVVPPRELLSKILANIKDATENETNRYLYRRGEKLQGRPSAITISKGRMVTCSS